MERARDGTVLREGDTWRRGQGRWYRRALAKARRRFVKLQLAGKTVRTRRLARLESEVNWKGT